MKPSKFNRFATVATLLSLSCAAFAADRVRNTAVSDLINDAAWDTVAPTSADRAVWNSTSAGGATTLGGNASWNGILISAGTPSSVSFTNAVNPSVFTLSLGAGGIDLNTGTSTNRGITFESNTRLDLTANQTWKLGLGGTGANVIVSSIISGTGALEITRDVAGSNYVQLGGANTFSGGVTAGASSWLRVASSSVTSGTSVTSGPTGTGNLTLQAGSLLATNGGTGQLIAAPQINLLGNATINQNSSGGNGRIQLAGVWDLGGQPRTLTVEKTNSLLASGNEGLAFIQPTGFVAPAIQNGSLTLATVSGTAVAPAKVRFNNTTTFSNNAGLTVGDGVVLTFQTSNPFSTTSANTPSVTLAADGGKGAGIIQMGDGSATMRNAPMYSLAGGGSISASNTTTTPAQTGTITIHHGNGAVFSGNISQGGTGIIAFTKIGAGSQTLSGTNSYTGKTTISAGTLQFGKQVSLYNNTTGLWTDTNLQVDSGATLALNVGGTGEFTSGDLSTLIALGSATGGFKSGAKIGIDTSNASGPFTHSSVIANPNSGSNALSLRKLGVGTLVLDQANTYTGGTTVEAGTLKVTQPAALGGSGTVNISPGAFLDADFSALGAAGTISRTLTGTGTIHATPTNASQIGFSSGILTSFTGTVNIKPSPASNGRADFNGVLGSGATINIESGATGRLAFEGTYSNLTVNVAGSGGSGPGALRLQNNTLLDASCTVNLTANASIGSFSPAISTIQAVIDDGASDFNLTKVGSSTLNLTGSNTYSGDTHVTGGTLGLGDGTFNTGLADSADVTLATGTTLNLNYTGTDVIDQLTINGSPKAAGIWGAVGSGAPNTDPQITGTGTLTVTTGPAPSSAFDTWASSFGLSGGNAAFAFDNDNDGLDNGLEWILGGSPVSGSSSGAPVATKTPSGDLVLSFTREEDSLTEATLTLEYDNNLDASWANSYVIDQDGGTDGNGVVVSINQAASPDAVTVTIPAALAPGGKIFARLRGVRN